MASGFIFGILIKKYQNLLLAAAACVMAGIVLYVLLSEPKARRTLRIWLFCYIGFFFLGTMRFGQKEALTAAYEAVIRDGMEATVQGTLSGKEWKGEQFVYHLKDCYILVGQEVLPCDRILIYQQTDAASVGQILIVEGTIALWESARNEGNFDAKAFYRSKNIGFSMKNASIKELHGRTDGIGERLFGLKKQIRNVYQSYLSEEDAGVLETMTMGDKSLLDAGTKQMYQKAGISHILAISGLHISILGMGIYQILRKMGNSHFAAGAAAFLLLGGYGVMSGMGTSTVRAVVMFAVMLAGQCLGRSYDLLSALSFAAVCLLWQNPNLLWYAGFLLSFAAVLGIAVTAQTLLAVEKPFLSVTESLLVSFSIQLATVPLSAYFFYEVPVWSMCMNYLILPLVGLLLFLGLSGGLFGIFFAVPAKLLFLPCHWILNFYKKICNINGKLPLSTVITGQPDSRKLVFFYLFLAVCLLAVQRRKSRKGFVLLTLCALLFVLCNPIRGFELDVLDVGQGDGIYLHTDAGTELFFDGGSTDVKKVGTGRILPFLKAKGVKQIDYWIVSHTDADHISGLVEVLEADYSVQNLVFSDRIPEDEAFTELTALAKNHGCNILKVGQGDAIRDKSMSLQCLFPDTDYGESEKNALSLVMEYEDSSFCGIFTGDISEKEENYLLSRADVTAVDFYKAAHHGSGYSNSELFLKQLSPSVTAISCGIHNRYGHPSADAVAHIEQTGSEIFYTMYSGRIRLRHPGGNLAADTYLPDASKEEQEP